MQTNRIGTLKAWQQNNAQISSLFFKIYIKKYHSHFPQLWITIQITWRSDSLFIIEKWNQKSTKKRTGMNSDISEGREMITNVWLWQLLIETSQIQLLTPTTATRCTTTTTWLGSLRLNAATLQIVCFTNNLVTLHHYTITCPCYNIIVSFPSQWYFCHKKLNKQQCYNLLFTWYRRQTYSFISWLYWLDSVHNMTVI